MENPNEPATKRQTFALFCMTKRDYRNDGLTKQQASDLIAQLKGEKGESPETKSAKPNFQAIWDEAVKAGREAVENMAVSPAIHLSDGNQIPEGHGPCGFAWLILKDARKGFAKWAKEKGIGRADSYYGGINVWISDYNQSMNKKETFAYAVAGVLSKHGIDARPMSRMD
jgi:hypothetical protein